LGGIEKLTSFGQASAHSVLAQPEGQPLPEGASPSAMLLQTLHRSQA